jgi:hypothetical protein
MATSEQAGRVAVIVQWESGQWRAYDGPTGRVVLTARTRESLRDGCRRMGYGGTLQRGAEMAWYWMALGQGR